MMNRTVVSKIKLTVGQGFCGPCVRNFRFEVVKFALVMQVDQID
jgi:hypothetical protein